jgi:hypothetical protein
MANRRRVLKVIGGVLMSSSLAGCSYFDEDRNTSINVGNYTEERKTIEVTVLNPESDTRSSLFREKTELGPLQEDSSNEIFQDAFKTRRALVEVGIIESDFQQQFIYQPSPACKDKNRSEYLEIQFHNPYSAKWDVACESE